MYVNALIAAKSCVIVFCNLMLVGEAISVAELIMTCVVWDSLK